MTLYTSDIELKTAWRYLLISLFCVLFGAVYEVFSYEVYSFFMIYAFVFPLLLGVLPFLLIRLRGARTPNPVCRNLYHAGVATLTVGSIIAGVVEIYGTTNALILLYWMVGILLLLIPTVLYLTAKTYERDENN